jgi:hypothetical protein
MKSLALIWVLAFDFSDALAVDEGADSVDAVFLRTGPRFGAGVGVRA